MLNEGVTYPFIVKGLVKNMDELSSSWILEDPYGAKHLVETASYHGYHFESGEKIYCKVDHINCSGQIYLEPPHPFYSEGKAYEFKMIGIEPLTSESGYVQPAVKLEGINGIICFIPLGIRPIPVINDKIIRCHIDVISKGQIFLSHPLINPKTGIIKHEIYELSIADIFTNQKKKAYFVLADSFGELFFIEAGSYSHYHLKKGQTIRCEAIRISGNGSWVMEPLHPYYCAGNTYKFNIIQQSAVFNAEGQNQELYISTDILGKRLAVPVEKALINATGTFFWYKIEKIRNGSIYTGF